MTSASSTATTAVAPPAAAFGSEPLTVAVADSPGFAVLMAEALGASTTAVPASCEAEAKPGEVMPQRREEKDRGGPADALLLAGLIQTWANTAPHLPASAPVITQEPAACATSSTGLLSVTEPADTAAKGQEPAAARDPASDPVTETVDTASLSMSAELRTVLPHPGPLPLGESVTQAVPVRQEAPPQFETATSVLSLSAGEGRGEEKNARQPAGFRIPPELSRTWSELPAVLGDSTSAAPVSESFLAGAVPLAGERTRPGNDFVPPPFPEPDKESEAEMTKGSGEPHNPAGQRPALPATIEPPAAPQFPARLVGERMERASSLGLFMTLDAEKMVAPDAAPAEGIARAGSVFTSSEARPKVETAMPFVRHLGSAAETKFTGLETQHLAAEEEWPAPLAGTGTAELADEMKQGIKLKQFADRAQQILPPAVATGWAPEPARHGGMRPAAEASGCVEMRPDAAVQLVSLLSSSQPGFQPAEALISLSAAATNAAAPTGLLQAGVLKHVTELRQTGATEMAVVLKPDAETQLSLRLTLSGSGEVTVQARCEQGDAQLLTANWGEIRHSLALQGVRLGALEFSPERGHDTFQPHAGNGGPSSDGQPSSQRHGPPWPETLDDLPLVGSLTEPPARRGVQRPPAGRNRRWESWA